MLAAPQQILLKQLTALAMNQIAPSEERGRSREFARLSRRAAPRARQISRTAVDRMVFIGLSRQSADEQFRDLRRCQVERIGNRPSQAFIGEFVPWFSGCIPLLTCCRFELHGMLRPDCEPPTDNELREGFSRMLRLPAELRPLLHIHRGLEAVEHLVWIGLGGESVILAETEISAQLKAAYRIAVEDKHLRRAPELHTLYQRALHTIRDLRDRHSITGGWATSLQRLAFDQMESSLLSAEASADPADWRIGIVGAGQMAFQLAAILMRKGLPADRLTFYVRNRERALAKPRYPEGVESRLLPQIADDLRAGRIHGLFGAVTHPLSVLQDEKVWSGLQRPVAVVDLSVPPMFEPQKFSQQFRQLNFVGFDELIARKGSRLEDAQERLEVVRKDAHAAALNLSRDVDKREASRALPLEELRCALRDRLGSEASANAASVRADVERLLDEAIADESEGRTTSAARRRRARARRRLIGLLRHQALEALKASLLPSNA